MEVRTSTLCIFSLLVVAVVTSGCGYTQQSKYQMSFLPPAPHHASEIVEQIGKCGLRYAEYPVHIHYSDYSRNKGQSLLNSVNIMAELLYK